METRRVLSERASKRRAMLKNLLGIAGLAVIPKIPRAQTTAPWLGDGGLLTDLGMELTPKQREAGVAFLSAMLQWMCMLIRADSFSRIFPKRPKLRGSTGHLLKSAQFGI